MDSYDDRDSGFPSCRVCVCACVGVCVCDCLRECVSVCMFVCMVSARVRVCDLFF